MRLPESESLNPAHRCLPYLLTILLSGGAILMVTTDLVRERLDVLLECIRVPVVSAPDLGVLKGLHLVRHVLHKWSGYLDCLTISRITPDLMSCACVFPLVPKSESFFVLVKVVVEGTSK